MKLVADRILGIVLMGLAAFAAHQAWNLQVLFSYEPVGPKAFPLVLSGILALLALVLIVRPGKGGKWPDAGLWLRILGVLGVLVVYALLFSRLGFMVTTFMTVVVLARLFGAAVPKALIAGVVMAAGSYVLFTSGLGIALPAGSWLPELL